MGEIKFRGKDKKTGKWAYGSYVYIKENRKGEQHFIFEYIVNEKTKDSYTTECVVSNKTIGRFTGIRDRMEEDIYEGDIVCDNFCNIGIIVYSVHFMGWRIRFKKGRKDLVERSVPVEIFSWVYPKIALEVIGNVFDNPELINH